MVPVALGVHPTTTNSNGTAIGSTPIEMHWVWLLWSNGERRVQTSLVLGGVPLPIGVEVA